MIETWKYASFRSIVTNQSSDLICLTMVGIVSILNLNLLREHFKCRRSKIGHNPHPSWEHEVPAVEPGLPVWQRDTFYGLHHQQGVNFLFHHPTLLWVHYSPDQTLNFEGWYPNKSVPPFYCMHDSSRYIRKALPI